MTQIKSFAEALVYAAAFGRNTHHGGKACMHRAYEAVMQLREPNRMHVAATDENARRLHDSFVAYRPTNA